MRPLVEVADLPLTLHKPSWKSGVHELRAGDETVGTLDVSLWSSGSVATVADHSWRFERPRGFLRRSVRVLAGIDDGLELGRYAGSGLGGRGGVLELGERDYELHARGFFKPRWSWSAGGRELAAFTAGGGLGELKGRFELTDDGRLSPDAPLLLLLGAHLALLSQRESAAAGGTAAAGASAAATG